MYQTTWNQLMKNYGMIQILSSIGSDEKKIILQSVWKKKTNNLPLKSVPSDIFWF